MRCWTSLANSLAENHSWSSSANQLWDAHRRAPANKEAASEVLYCFDFKRCRLQSNYLSRRWWHIIEAVVLPCSYLSLKPGWVWSSGTNLPFDGNIQNFNFSPKVRLTRSRQSRCISPLVSFLGGGVPPREMFPGGPTATLLHKGGNFQSKDVFISKAAFPLWSPDESGWLCSPQCLLKQPLSPDRKSLNRCKTWVF